MTKELVPEAAEKEMSFLDHLEELRWHIIRSLGAMFIAAIAFFSLKDFVFKNIIFAPKNDGFLTYKFFCWMSEMTCFQPKEFDLITREIGEQFFTHIKVSLYLALIFMFPYIFYEFWRFIKPGLYKNEKKAAGGMVFSCTSLFFLGIAFGYFVIVPFALNFLIGYSVGPDAISSPTLSSYVSYLTLCTLPTGFVFQMPVLVYFLSRIGFITPGIMRRFRKHSIVVILILAAVITPPDVISQFLIGIPIFILYEISIVISSRVEKKRKQQDLDNT